MNYQALKDMLTREHYRSGWGCLLAFREKFKDWYSGGLLLDIGCDVGLLAGLVGEENYVGLDVVCYGSHPSLFVLADGHKLPFKSEIFDFVSMVEVLEHLTDPTSCLKEISRVLKKNGRFFIQSVYGEDPCFERDPTHLWSFNKTSLTRLLRRFFSVVMVEHRGGTLIARVEKA
jgi:SAM-dependent methyltransferase